jgi:hypothetical protein
VAVRIDIRPRLTLREELPVKPRRRFRLPPLALPATGYWLAMGALTYFFANLDGSALDLAGAAPFDEPVGVPVPAPMPMPMPATEPGPSLASAPAPAPAVTVPQQPELQAVTEPEPALVTRSEPQAQREKLPAPSSHEPAPRAEPRARREEPVARLQFPEFTDSSSPARRERAADGPRIDSLFERRVDQPEGDAAPPAPAPAPAPDSEREAPTTVSSCENAIARNNEQISIGGPRGPTDITREAYAGILQNGRYLSGCSIPDRTVFEICAAVRDGRAVGVTVTSSPQNASLNSCVRRAVSRLKFPQNPRLDVTHTRFDAATR